MSCRITWVHLNKNLINIEPNLLHNGAGNHQAMPPNKIIRLTRHGGSNIDSFFHMALSLSQEAIDIASITFQFRKDKLRTVSSFLGMSDVLYPITASGCRPIYRRPRNVQALGCKLTKPLHSEWDDIFGNHLVKKRLSLCQNSHI